MCRACYYGLSLTLRRLFAKDIPLFISIADFFLLDLWIVDPRASSIWATNLLRTLVVKLVVFQYFSCHHGLIVLRSWYHQNSLLDPVCCNSKGLKCKFTPQLLTKIIHSFGTIMRLMCWTHRRLVGAHRVIAMTIHLMQLLQNTLHKSLLTVTVIVDQS